MKAVHPYVVAAAILLLPNAALAQSSGDPAIEGRLNGLRQQLANLSSRINELKIQDQQLEERLEKMRTNFEIRLGQQDYGAKGKAR